MKDTHKIKTAIKLLKEVDSENKNNYFTINKKKYFVFKNGVFNEKNETPVGSIKNGVIIFDKPLFRSKKNTKKGTRKVKSSYLESKPVINASIPMNKPVNMSIRRNTNKKNMNKPVIDASIPMSNESTISNSYNPLFSKNFSEPEPMAESVQEPEQPVQEPMAESVQEPVEEPVTETEEPYDEHKEDL